MFMCSEYTWQCPACRKVAYSNGTRTLRIGSVKVCACGMKIKVTDAIVELKFSIAPHVNTEAHEHQPTGESATLKR